MPTDEATDRQFPFDASTIDRYISGHLNADHASLNDQLEFALRNCKSHGLPNWATISSQGKFFKLQCQLLEAREVLEIGTLGGHTAIWCTAAHPELRFTTMEVEPSIAAVAVENVEAAGVGDRVEILVGSAQDHLPRLAQDIQQRHRKPFDMVIIDVEDFGKIWQFLDIALGACRIGACVMAHCQLRKSNLDIPAEQEQLSRTKGSRELVERAGKDPRIDGAVLMTVGEQLYDLFLGIVKET